MPDGTPVLDIKPYVKYFDSRGRCQMRLAGETFQRGGFADETVLEKEIPGMGKNLRNDRVNRAGF